MTKKNMSKNSFKISCFLKKNEKKIFFQKTGLPAKPRNFQDFFPDSFLKINSLQAYIKKIKKIDL